MYGMYNILHDFKEMCHLMSPKFLFSVFKYVLWNMEKWNLAARICPTPFFFIKDHFLQIRTLLLQV
jgi:hypothetical protein